MKRRRRPTKVETSARRLLEALDRQAPTHLQSLNVRSAREALRTTLSAGR